MARVIIGLGSNLGNRQKHIEEGLKLLTKAGVNIIKVSLYYRTLPAERTSGGKFLNGVSLIETSLEPEPLLKLLKKIEEQSDRPRRHRPKEARTLDLDIIYYENSVIDKPGLQIPHPRRFQRWFVMKPAVEIAPDFCDPILKKKLKEIDVA